MANKHLQKRLTSLAIREMHIKITLRFHCTSVSMYIIEKSNEKWMLISILGERNPYSLLFRMYTGISTTEIAMDVYPKAIKLNYHMTQPYHWT